MLLAQIATIILIGPFTGTTTEGFESNPLLCKQKTCVPGRIFNGRADLCVSGDTAGAGDCTIAASLKWGEFPAMAPKAGLGFLWTQTTNYPSSCVDIIFDEPVSRFGGYFGSWSIVAELDFTFYAEDGTLIQKIHDGNSPANSVWTWQGFDFSGSGPVKRVRIGNSAWFGVSMDGLQADIAPLSQGTDTCFPGYSPVIACPCSATNKIPNGCANSAAPGGAHVGSSGVASLSADTLVLTGNKIVPGVQCSIVQAGLALRTSSVIYGQGVSCWSSPPVRLFTGPAANGSITTPGLGQPAISLRSAQYGYPLTTGMAMTYCIVYRDPAAFGSCAAGMLNVTNAHNIVWLP